MLDTAVQKFLLWKRGAKHTAKGELSLPERHEGKKYRTLPAEATQMTQRTVQLFEILNLKSLDLTLASILMFCHGAASYPY